jgi:hypothetical protein
VASATGAALTGLAAVLSTAASTQALADLGAGRPVTVRSIYGKAVRRGFALVGTTVVLTVVITLLLVTLVLSPLALVVLVLSAVTFPVVQLEGTWGLRAMARSWHLVRHQWAKVLGLLVFLTLLATLLGGLLGSALVLAFQVPFVIVNVVPGVVIALLGPYLALVVAYAYFHGVADQQRRSAESNEDHEEHPGDQSSRPEPEVGVPQPDPGRP